jgi:DNA modification methylase
MSEAKIIHGDNRATLATLPERSFHCCVTSPPYWGLRDYGVDGQIGMEGTPDDFVSSMRATFAGVWRVLRDDGVLWLNLGDTYHQGRGARGGRDDKYPDGRHRSGVALPNERVIEGLKPKDLVGIPWRVAFALQEDGWYLRDAIIWHKPAPMPGSQRDRCTASYEFIFQLTKSRRYFFDLDAIKKPLRPSSVGRLGQDLEMQAGSTQANGGGKTNGAMKAVKFGGNKGGGEAGSASRLYSGNSWKGSSFTSGKTGAVHENQGQGERDETGESAPRNVWDFEWTEADLEVLLAYMNGRHEGENRWTMASGGFKEAHFATFPIELPLRCIKASTSSKGCCSNCGAPWQRVTERTALKRSRPNELTKRTGEDGTGNHCANTVAGVEARTIGWEPTCECGAEVVPCRVLDPFNGAGTTGVACRRLGVDYVGCELNQEYIEMSYRRFAREANRDSKLKPVKAAAGQAELF